MGAASLAEETRLLQAAQRELARKRTSAALALLDEHAAKFPRGALAEERTAARVLALCDLGRVAEARSSAEAFARASPRSPLIPRLRGSCALSDSNAGNENE
jgi:outer membrane protein assembly factor BamD (BamD/ComL family)